MQRASFRKGCESTAAGLYGGKMELSKVSSEKIRHANNFGAIRLILAALVVYHHSYSLSVGNLHHELWTALTSTFGPGTVAVFGFFTLSGFLITQSWCRQPKLYSFCLNRFLRIYPGYAVSAIVTIFLIGWLGSDVPDYFQRLPKAQLIKCIGFFVIPQGFPSFGGQTIPGNLNGAVWTIAFEAICYMLVAFAGATRLLRRSNAWLVVFVASLAVRRIDMVAMVSPWIRPPYCYLFSGISSLIPFFLAGMCYYLYQERLRPTRVGVILMASLLLGSVFNKELAPIGYAIAGSYLLFTFAFAEIPWLRPIGQRVDLSYGIYLYHWPCQQLLLRYLPDLSPLALFPLSLAAASGLAWLSWHLVESPCLRLRRRGTNPSALKDGLGAP